MKKLTKCAILLAISSTAFAASATEQTEEVNYGDPTASFSTVGTSVSENTTQLNGMMGLGSNIFSLDLGVANKDNGGNEKGDLSYRGRYFHVTDGLGYSVDVLGDKNSTTALAGAIYKFQVTDNISVFPMLSAGYTKTDTPKGENKNESGLGQVGIYAMYGFDAGHWVYVNPKSTYHIESKEFINQVEAGGGIMVLDNVSVGAKLEYTAKSDYIPEDTVGWIQANVYF
ncbi:MAG: hypothetical protein V7782_02160 [Psychromonas sp.]